MDFGFLILDIPQFSIQNLKFKIVFWRGALIYQGNDGFWILDLDYSSI